MLTPPPFSNYEMPDRMPKSKDIYVVCANASVSMCGVSIFPQKLDQCTKSRTPMYAFNILLRFNGMVSIVESTRDAYAMRQKC